MGNLTVKRGNIQIDYGTFILNNGATTWTAKNGTDNILAFSNSGNTTGVAGFSGNGLYSSYGSNSWTLSTSSAGGLNVFSSLGGQVSFVGASAAMQLTPYGAASSAIEIGTGRAVDGYAYIDLVGDTTYTDWGIRLIRNNTGLNAASQLACRGTGGWYFITNEAAPIFFQTTAVTRGLWTAGGNFVIGNYTGDIQSAYKLQLDTASRALIGGGLTVGGNQANTDAAIHVAGVGNTTNNRMLQLAGNGSYSLNISQGVTGNWWAWGVDSSNRYCINPGTTFTTTGLMLDTASRLGLGVVPSTGYKADILGSATDPQFRFRADFEGSTTITAGNATQTGALTQAYMSCWAKNGAGDFYMNMGQTSASWAVASGAAWDILNGGSGYIQSTSGKLSIISNSASGVLNFLAGGPRVSNIVLRISAAGNFAFGYGALTDATEKIQIKNGNIKLDGISGNHGIIFPDNTIQTTAFTPYTLPVASTTVLGGVKVDGTSITIDNGVISTTGKHAIQDEGAATTLRSNLNFVGSLVAVTDDATNDATVVTINPTGVVLSTEKGAANGVATLDASGLVPLSQLRYIPRRIQTLTNVSGAVSLDWSTYDEIRLTLTGNTILTFTGALDGQGCILKIREDATGGHALVLPMSVRYNTDINTYVQTTTANAIDRLGFIYDGEDAKYDFVSMTRNLI